MHARPSWPPVTADDAAIAAALADGHAPTLLVTLVHLTGDPAPLHGDIRPSGDFLSTLADPQAGITAAAQAVVRERALAALAAYRDRGCTLPPDPSPDTVRAMIGFLIGQPVPPAYADFLEAQLALDGRDPYHRPLAAPPAARAAMHVVIVGAGMSGLLAGIRLREAGIPFTIVEKNPDVGGTWYENTYPGCRVDSPNHTYAYSFAPHDWPYHFSPQPVLLDYFRQCAARFGVRDAIRFSTEVVALAFDEAARCWHVRVRTPDGGEDTLRANAVISAVGQLNRPRYADIPGRERFAGIAFHSARWEHGLDPAGKRIGVIGTGASAFQFVPVIAERAAAVVVFQRTPPWVVPSPQYLDPIPPGKQWLLRHVPHYATWYRFWMFWRTTEGLLSMVAVDPAWPHQERSVSAANDLLRIALTEYTRAMLAGAGPLVEQAIPGYPPAAKRMLVDSGAWYQALRRPNVRLVTEPVVEITPAGPRTADGEVHAVDVLIHATGFHASRFLWPMRVTGRGGLDLHAHWNGDARAYLGITIPGFPNLFCLYGPNTNIVVNGSIVFFSECAVRYILGCLDLLLREGHAAMDCRPEVHDAYNAMIDRCNAAMAWGAPGVNSWYKNARGRVSQNWPLTLLDYWTRTLAPDPADYVFL